MAQKAGHRLFPLITCYPTHGKKLAQRGDCRISQRCSVSPSPQLYRCLVERHRAPTHRRRQHSNGVSLHPQGARLALRLVRQGDGIQWANLCLETAFSFCLPLCQTKSCSELLKLQLQSTYMCYALMGHSNAKAGSASSKDSACRFTT